MNRFVVAILSVIVFAILAFVASRANVPADSGQWMSLIPPLLAILLSVITGRVLISLGAAVLAGSAIHQHGQPVASATQFLNYFWNNTAKSASHLLILAFLVILMAMASVMLASGGTQAMVDKLKKWARTTRMTQLVTMLMGIVVFFDDYANCVIVGTSARPLTDAQRISREKLSFLVDATAAPISGIALISTWIGYEVGLFDTALKAIGSDMNGYEMFICALPYRFYCILLVSFVFFSIMLKRDYGSMYRAERRARLTGEVSARGARVAEATGLAKQATHWANAVVPILLVFFASVILLFVDGGGVKVLSENPCALFSLGVWRKCLSAANSPKVLTYVAILGLLTATALPLLRRDCSFKELSVAAWRGAKASWLMACILLLAWSLGSTCEDLKTASFLTAAVKDALSPTILPGIIFLTASAVAFTTGTSWGTMAILLPATIPLANELGGMALVTITMGCVLDGAIFGDHCSPISDTTILSSSASTCDHLAHVRTQLPYAVTVMVAALLCGYLPAAFGAPAWTSWLIGTVALVSFLLLFGRNPEAGALQAPETPALAEPSDSR